MEERDIQCCFTVGPASATLGQNYNDIGSACGVGLQECVFCGAQPKGGICLLLK